MNPNCPINKSETDYYFLNLDRLKKCTFLYIAYDFDDKDICIALHKKWLFEQTKQSNSNNTSLIHNETKETEDLALKERVIELKFQNKNIIKILIAILLIQGLTFLTTAIK
jgi:hypothetical protein